jgi:ribonuclease E
MSKRILINAVHAEEVRIVLVEDDIVIDLCYEINSNEHIKGNVYKGRVVRVEPGLQAAFVEYSDRRHGFLPFKEISSGYYCQEHNKNRRRLRIQDVIKKNQEILVQVEREERDSKGASLTTYLSIAGRYIVMMPGEKKRIGVSKKIEDSQLRERIKDIFEALKPPEEMAFILRTAGIDKKKSDFASDLKYLMKQWTYIQEQSEKLTAPALVYKEQDVSMKYIRDYLGPDIDEVLVDERQIYRDIRDFLKQISPAQQKLIKLYRDKKPIFLSFNVEKQLENIHKRHIPLSSGGYIVIDKTEALTSIDINSGKSISEEDIEFTALKTNLEAADEIARQLRLRDIGGLIVIDFIDMAIKKHRHKIERRMKEAVKLDKAHTEFAHISNFGLLEMSRERLRQTMSDATDNICPYCVGLGKIKSPEALAMAALRKIQYEVFCDKALEIVCTLPTASANYLLNEKRSDIITLEKDQSVVITLRGSDQISPEDFDIKIIKKQEQVKESTDNDTAPAKEAAQKATTRTKKKRTRRKRSVSTHVTIKETSTAKDSCELTQADGALSGEDKENAPDSVVSNDTQANALSVIPSAEDKEGVFQANSEGNALSENPPSIPQDTTNDSEQHKVMSKEESLHEQLHEEVKEKREEQQTVETVQERSVSVHDKENKIIREEVCEISSAEDESSHNYPINDDTRFADEAHFQASDKKENGLHAGESEKNEEGQDTDRGKVGTSDSVSPK